MVLAALAAASTETPPPQQPRTSRRDEAASILLRHLDAHHHQQPGRLQQLALQLLEAAAPQPSVQHQRQQQLPPHATLELLTDAAVATLPQLRPQQVADVLQLLAQCQQEACQQQQEQQQEQEEDLADQQAADASSTPQQQSQLARALNAYLKQRQRQMDAASTAAVAAALAAHRQHSSLTIVALLAMDRLPQMSNAQLVQLLGAFATAEHYNAAVCDAAAQLAAQRLQAHGLQAPGAHGDGGSGQAAASSRQRNRKQQPGEAFSSSQLTALLAAFTQLRHYVPQLLDAACTATLQQPDRSLAQLVPVVHACAALNHFHLQLFDTAVDAAHKVLVQALAGGGPNSSSSSSGQAAEQQQLSQLLADLAWSCGVVQHWDDAFLQQLTAWTSRIDAASLAEPTLLQWYEVQTSLIDAAITRPGLASGLANAGLGSSLLVAAQAAWARRLQRQRRLAAFQKEVLEALRQAGVRCRVNVALDGPVCVDIALQQRQVGARYKVALQLHPETDFAANASHAPLGPTAARWRALQARGWQVVSIQQSEWRRLRTDRDRVQYAWQIGQGVGVTTPGSAQVAKVVLTDAEAVAQSPKPSITQKLWRMMV